MTFEEVRKSLDGVWVTDGLDDSQSVSNAYTSDLLSDVMGNAPDDSVLVTIQNHLNTIAVCTLAGIKIVAVCHDRDVPQDMKDSVVKQELTDMTTRPKSFRNRNSIRLKTEKDGKSH